MSTEQKTDGATEDSEPEKEMEKEGEKADGARRIDVEALKEMMENGMMIDEVEALELDSTTLGGKLQTRPESWATIGARELIERGVQPEWEDQAPPRTADWTRRERYIGMMHDQMMEVITEEINKGVLEIVEATAATYILAAFFVRKVSGSLRLILDCRPLNEFIRQQHFKLEDWVELKRRLRRYFFGCTMDFSSAFHHLGVSPELWYYVCFRYDGVIYRYRGLPFGLRSAPRVFTRAMRETVRAIREIWPETIVSFYMDDMIVFHQSETQLATTMNQIVTFVRWLGWTPNLQKSVLIPSQRIVYLGLEWDTVKMAIRMTAEKNRKLKAMVKTQLKHTRAGKIVKAKELASVIGKLSATRPQHEEASLYLARLNRRMIEAVRADGWRAKTALTRDLLSDLHWWLETLRRNEPNSIRRLMITVQLDTDASESGWGSTVSTHTTLQERWTYGLWINGQSMANCLRELEAVIQGLRYAVEIGLLRAGQDVRVRCDNTNVVYNINRKRSGWRMRKRLKTLFRWLKEMKIRVECVYLPGTDNTTADRLSRLSRSGNYSLVPGLIERIEKRWNITVDADLFATRANRQRLPYGSIEGDPDSLGNAMHLDSWSTFNMPLIHPPIPLLTRSLNRIQDERMRALVIGPTWHGEMWSGLIRQMTVRKLWLGKTDEVLIPGPNMVAVNATIPPGEYGAWLIDGRQDRAETIETKNQTATRRQTQKDRRRARTANRQAVSRLSESGAESVRE
jgi:ribonuclease HI